MVLDPATVGFASIGKLGVREPDSYEAELDRDLGFAMSEGSRHFQGSSQVQLALQKIARRLSELDIPYAVAGGMALFAHGLRRFTEYFDVLVTAEALNRIHAELDGLGYIRRFETSKNLRDVEHKVRIEFIVTGQYPGDGKPKPVSFPDPAAVAEERDGIRYVNLQTLIELKLASGMSGSDRLKDLADVQEMIKLLSLPGDFGNKLSDYVRPKYQELWAATTVAPKRYLLLWRHPPMASKPHSIDDLISQLGDRTDVLRAMKAEGLTLDPDQGTGDGYVYLATTDPEVAGKYGMEDEHEFWGRADDSAKGE